MLSTTAIITKQYAYRFIYFDVRGAGELCRLVLSVSGFDWADVRYPMTLSEHGFAYGPEFRRDVATGAFRGNFNNLPVMQVLDDANPKVALATIGQSHTIARFVAGQHATLMNGGTTANAFLEQAKVDSIYESCRDIKSAWYRIKSKKGGKAEWFDSRNSWTDGAPISLYDHCQLLEGALGVYSATTKTTSSSPWCLGGTDPTLADISIYHMLSTSMSPMSGSTVTFFDGGEKEAIRQAYDSFPRLVQVVDAVGQLKAIQQWEDKRPDTFT
jgi:glutathione S-transferase